MDRICRAIQATDVARLAQSVKNSTLELTLKEKEDSVRLASECGNPECIAVLLQAGFPVSSGWDSPVIVASEKGYLKCLELLMQHFSTDQISCSWFNLPTTKAIDGNHVQCLLLLLDFVHHNFPGEDATQHESTALFYSVRTKQSDCVDAMVRAVFPVNVCKDSTGKEPLWYAIAENSNTECDIAKMILHAPSFVFSYDSFKSALEIAVRKGNEEMVSRILDVGSQWISLDSRCWSDLIHSAVKAKTFPTLKLLSSHLHQSGVVAKIDFAPVICTATQFKTNSVGILRTLRDNGVKLDLPRSSGTTAVIESVKNNNKEALAFLLDLQEIPLDRVDERGLTALMHACRSGQDEAVASLLQHGANPHLKTQGGKTALFFASRDSPNSVRHLVSHGAHVNVVDHIGLTPLLECAKRVNANVTIATALIDAGANVNYQSNLKSALYYALSGKYHHLVVELLKAGTCFRVFALDEILICDTIKQVLRKEPQSPMAVYLYACGADTFIGMEHYLEHFDPSEKLLPPCSLRHLSRITIRKWLLSCEPEVKNILYHVTLLPLPVTLQRYILYNVQPCAYTGSLKLK